MRHALHIALALTLLMPLGVACAAPIPAADYATAMARLDAIETRMDKTRAALATGLAPNDAQSLAPQLAEDLAWLRRTKITAARLDVTPTPTRNLTPERLRARCLVMRTGLLDPALQDLATNASLKARGARDETLIPASASPAIPPTPLACRP